MEEKEEDIEEEWKDVKGYEGRYRISNMGRVRNKNNRILKTHMLGNYSSISFRKKKQNRESYRIHHLVANHFIKKPKSKNKLIVDHVNHNKLNNKYTNLRWITQSDNINHYNKTIKKDIIKPILQYNKNMKLIKEWKNMNEIKKTNKKYNISFLYCCLNNTYKYGYGYIWKYKYNNKNEIELKKDEVFKNIGTFGNCDFSNYEVSNYGNLKSIRYNKFMRFNKTLDHMTVMLYDKNTGKGKRLLIHRLVAYKFVNGMSDIYNVVNHIDERKRNNYYKNLEWVTRRKNTIHSLGKKIKQINKKTNKIINTFNSIADASKALGKGGRSGNITNCCKGNRKSAYGYKWEYVK